MSINRRRDPLWCRFWGRGLRWCLMCVHRVQTCVDPLSPSRLSVEFADRATRILLLKKRVDELSLVTIVEKGLATMASSNRRWRRSFGYYRLTTWNVPRITVAIISATTTTPSLGPHPTWSQLAGFCLLTLSYILSFSYHRTTEG